MIEIVFAVVLAGLVLGMGVLVYYLFRKDLEHREATNRLLGQMQAEFHQSLGSVSVERQKMDDLVEKTFSNYLKHIQLLEKQLVKPEVKPKESRTSYSIPLIPNEIDKKEDEKWEEVTEENMDKIIKSSPKIKIINSDDWRDLPTTVI